MAGQPQVIAPAVPESVAFPVPCMVFIRTLKGTPDEVYSKLLLMQHGREKHTPAQWQATLDAHRNEPAHPGR